MQAKQVLSIMLLVIVLSQSLLLGSGLLGLCAEDASKICSCNHGSEKEKHASAEDSLFKRKVTKKLISQNSKKSLAKAGLTCHTSKTGETHICACKKTKSSMAKLSIFHQVWIADIQHFNLIRDDFEIISFLSPSESYADGWTHPLLKPPRILTI